MGCGHSTFSETPVRYCEDVRTKKHPAQPIAARSNTQKLAEQETCIQVLAGSGTDGPMDSRSSLQNDGASKRLSNSTIASHASSYTAVQTYDDYRGEEGEMLSFEQNASQTDGVESCREGRVHPLHTIRLDRMCPICTEEREERLRGLDSSIRGIKFDPARWHWKYQGAKTNASRKQEGRWTVGAAKGGWMRGWNKRDTGDSVIK